MVETHADDRQAMRPLAPLSHIGLHAVKEHPSAMPTLPRPVRYRCEMYARIESQHGHLKARVLEMSETGAFLDNIFAWLDKYKRH